MAGFVAERVFLPARFEIIASFQDEFGSAADAGHTTEQTVAVDEVQVADSAMPLVNNRPKCAVCRQIVFSVRHQADRKHPKRHGRYDKSFHQILRLFERIRRSLNRTANNVTDVCLKRQSAFDYLRSESAMFASNDKIPIAIDIGIALSTNLSKSSIEKAMFESIVPSELRETLKMRADQ